MEYIIVLKKAEKCNLVKCYTLKGLEGEVKWQRKKKEDSLVDSRK